MKRIQFKLIPEGGFHPVDELLGEADGVHRRAIHQLNPLGTERALVMYELEGRLDENERLLEEIRAHPDIIELEVRSVDREIYAYAQFRVSDTLAHLALLTMESEFIVKYPLEYTKEGGLRIYAIGSVAGVNEFESQLPDDISLELEEIGEHSPEGDRLWAQLTERQKEILQAAIRLGYYNSPRDATYGDIAADLGISAGTVGEHLQKIEKRILTRVAPEPADGR